MKKKKILALDQGEYLGGAERFFSELLTRLPEEYEINIFTGENNEYHSLYKNSSVNIHTMSIPRLRPFGLASFLKLKKVRKEITSKIDMLKPDLIISNTVRTHIYSSQICKRKAIPLIWMAHDITFPGSILRFLKNTPYKVICCSRLVEKHYQKYMGNTGNKCTVLYPFGIEKKILSKISQVSSEDLIGMIGNFIPWKGHDIFIRLAKKIHQRFPNIRFQILGDIYKDKKESMEFYKKCIRLKKELGLGSVLSINKSDKVLEDIAHWEILIHCSREAEPLGRVVLEGMATGCTVIASDLGGPKEIIDHDKTGLLCKPSLSPILHLVENLIQDDERRKRISNEAKTYIKKTYTWGQVIEKFVRVMEKAIIQA